MYKLQFCNACTQEVLREVAYDKPDFIHNIVESAENSNPELDNFILDSQQRLFRAEYVSHSSIHLSNATVYRIFFKVKLHDVQPLIRQ